MAEADAAASDLGFRFSGWRFATLRESCETTDAMGVGFGSEGQGFGSHQKSPMLEPEPPYPSSVIRERKSHLIAEALKALGRDRECKVGDDALKTEE
eukprot:CAMPEP_0184328524 /NCGR_PEP_ID=MMETSP1049-20130417/143668_1 /TAXON_ID=77928 /ORGANISM="Proteomonas sulcata, Strain CCMP704" /LENGTH=96 /DNA_ID=CAMNT_0026650841 /DNA_START=696 /DNA_END=988 /DNA_ORIENTATION=-